MEKKAQRRTGRRQMAQKQQDGQASLGRLNTCGPYLKGFVQRVRNRSRLKTAKQNIKDLLGRHNPIDYRPEYNFQERWQSIKEPSSISRKYPSLKNDHRGIQILQQIIIICMCISLWFLSTYRTFQMDTINNFMIILIVITQVTDILLQQKTLEEEQENKQTTNLGSTFKKHLLSIIFLFYLCFLIVEQQVLKEKTLPLMFVDIIFIVKLYKRLKNLYLIVKIRIPTNWRNEMEIAQLIGGCLALVHVFSILLWLAAQSDSRSNWTMALNNVNRNWGYKYLFSLYFACSTMFTVGYGDITPENTLEITTILVVQIVGIINMGYVINQVGRFLSKINESEDLLYRDISEAEKLSKNYDLPGELSKKVTSYVIKNQIANNKFNHEEQQVFLQKLSQQVRQDVCEYNKFQLIKTSMFFLCHWTKRFQKIIANNLIRVVYSPDEILQQIEGKEKLYILNKGKIDIETFLQKKQQLWCRRRLAVLEEDPTKDVHFNTYGYTTLISGLKVNLRAVARDYSICYYVDKDTILSAISESKNDFEYFHEIRSKIEQSKCKEAFQAPKISNNKEHYIPSTYFIVKRAGKKCSGKQLRTPFMGRKSKKNFVLQEQNEQNSDHIMISMYKKCSLDYIKDTESEQIQGNMSSNTIKSRHQAQLANKKYFILDFFDEFHDYSSYRKKFNSQKTIEKYNKLFFKEESLLKFLDIKHKTSQGLKKMRQDAVSRSLKVKTT